MTVKIVIPFSDIYVVETEYHEDKIIEHALEYLDRVYFEDFGVDAWVKNPVVIFNKDEDGPGVDRVEFNLIPLCNPL